MRSKNKGQKFDADTEWRKDLLYIAWTKEYLLLHKKGSSARQAIRRQFGKKAGPTSDFASFEVMRKFFDTAENGDYDNFAKKVQESDSGETDRVWAVSFQKRMVDGCDITERSEEQAK